MPSLEHQIYLKKIRRNKILVFMVQIFLIAVALLLWEFCAKEEIINSFISSSPSEIISTIIHLHQTSNLWQHIGITVYETLLSFGIATILGILIATFLWWNSFIAKVLDPYLTIINSLPKVALGPIIIIWAGAGMNSIIIMALLISLIITIMNVYQSFQETDANKLKLLKSFHATKVQTFFKLVLPSNLSTIVSALKINISMSLIGL